MYPADKHLFLTVLVTAASALGQDWQLQAPPTSPAGATFPRMAYDAQRGRCVAFGGWNAPIGSIVFQDTWEYDGSTWILRTPATVPDERESHAMAYDSVRNRMVMFGGWDFNFVKLGATWEWDGTDWLDRQPQNAPSPRILSAMAYDSARGVTVLFGGEDTTLRGDTWEWNGTNWQQRTPANAPSPRTSHAMAFDAVRGRVVLFGGHDGTNFLGDTWEYDGGNWTLRTLDGAPSPRVDCQLAYDSQRARIVLFGGGDATLDRNDTWEYDGQRWRQLFTATRPQGNSAMAMVHDSARGRTVVFGGFDGVGAIDDTWELGGAAAVYGTFGTGCVGSNGRSPRLDPIDMPAIGATTRVDVVDLPGAAGQVYLVAGGSDQSWAGVPLPIDLSPIGLTGCRAYTSGDAGVLLTHTAGAATWTFAIPAVPALAGTVLFLQAFSFDAAAPRPVAGALSNAAAMEVR